MKKAHEELDEFNAKVEATKKSFKEWEKENESDAMPEGIHRIILR